MAIILNLALCFGGNGFYQHHTHFASKAAACLYQFNEDTYWCTLNNEIYCRIFAPQAALLCALCHASSHPASFCAIPVHVKPWYHTCKNCLAVTVSRPYTSGRMETVQLSTGLRLH